jgi:putative transposase
MPRLARLCLPGLSHHVLQRGNNRQAVFFDEEGRRLFLRWLGEAATAEGCAVHAYVLMTNHFHLAVTAGRADSIPRMMQSLGRRYVGYVNRALGRTGTLWEGRYKSTVVDSETYLLACLRYIEANPLRAGMVARPEDHPWSSYRGNALGRRDPLLTAHETYCALGTTSGERQAAYRALFAEGLDGEQLDALRDSIQRGWAPGSDRFRREVEAASGRRADVPRRGRPPKKQPQGEDGGQAILPIRAD